MFLLTLGVICVFVQFFIVKISVAYNSVYSYKRTNFAGKRTVLRLEQSEALGSICSFARSIIKIQVLLSGSGHLVSPAYTGGSV